MLCEEYLHPNGQMPAYEWNFGDVNPPVDAFATLFLRELEADLRRGGPPVPPGELREAAAELHLVGQPEGSDRQ